MNQASRPSALLTVVLLAVATQAMAGSSTGKALQAPQAATTTPAPGAIVAPVTVQAPIVALGSSLPRPEATWPEPGWFWTPLPSRFDTWNGSAMRVEWDAEAGTWGMSSGPDPAAAGVFGARLPSDPPIQISRRDGSVMVLIGAEGTEYLTVRRGPDGHFHMNCDHGPLPSVAPTLRGPEK